MKQRLAEFDFIRSVAAMAVIGIHVTASWALSTPGGFVANQVVRFAVPLFIIISGFLLFFQEGSLTVSEPRSHFFRSRFGKIVWPYLIWTVVYMVLNQQLVHQTYAPAAFLEKLTGHLLLGTASYHLYFMVIIIQCYLLYPLLRGWMYRMPGQTLTGAFLLNAGVQILLYLNTIGIYHLPAIKYPDIYLVAFPGWIFYFVFGMYSARYRGIIESWLHKKLVFTGILWLVSLGVLLWESSLTGSLASSNKPTILLYTTVTFFFLYSAGLQYTSNEIKGVEWLSKQSFLIYLIHPAILLVLQRIAALQPAAWVGMLGMVIQYFLTVAFSCIIVYILSRIPFVAYLGGCRAVKSLS